MIQLNNNGQFLFINEIDIEAVEITWFSDEEFWKFDIYCSIHTYSLITKHYEDITEWLDTLEIEHK